MSLKSEQCRALKYTREFMLDLINPSFSLRRAKDIRKRASQCLRHFPFLDENGCPMWGGDVDQLPVMMRIKPLIPVKSVGSMWLLGLCGRAGVGKTALANALVARSGATVIPLAWSVKDIAAECFGWDGAKDEKGRRLLQVIGTEAGRAYNEDMWVNLWRGMYLKHMGENPTPVVVDDVRFQNEVDVIAELGGITIRLDNERGVTLNHASENPDSLKVDCAFNTAGLSPEEEAGIVSQLLEGK